MSAAYLPPDPSSDLLPEPVPKIGSNPSTTIVPVRSPERPIRFPHIPSIDQTPPGMALYIQQQQQALRVDQAHELASISSSPAAPSVRPIEARPRPGFTEQARSASTAPPESSQVSTADGCPVVLEREPVSTTRPRHSAELPHPTRVRPAESPTRDGWRSLSTQVEQIAGYLRRRRNELETEQTDLKLTALMQEAALLQEREHLRGQQLNIQMVQATLEILRRQLLDFGNALSEVIPADHSLQYHFEAVCQAYYDVGSVARLLDADQ